MVSALYPHKVGVGNTTNGGLRGERRFVMCLDMADGEFKEIGDRLKAIREAFSKVNLCLHHPPQVDTVAPNKTGDTRHVRRSHRPRNHR
jgi:hypothetical protein